MPAFGAFTGVAGGVSTIEETRIDPYVMLSGEQGAAKWEAGLRYETTDTTITDRTVDPTDQVNDNDYDFLLPSASLRYNLNDRDRLIVSAARTVRRPNFDSLSPALLEEEVGDSDFIGNPDLNPLRSHNLDLGIERTIGGDGVVSADERPQRPR